MKAHRTNAIFVVALLALTVGNARVPAQTCGTAGKLCNGTSSCDDGDPCNGTETCSPPDIIRFCRCGTPPCVDGSTCTQDICTVERRGVFCSHPPVVCDDGLFCNGGECCFGSYGCTLCVPPPCNGFRFCDEANDRCTNCLTDADCDQDNYTCYTLHCDFAAADCRGERCEDQLFCGGRVRCDSIHGCRPGLQPCTAGELCNESNDRCSDCTSSADCADNDPCSIDVCDPDRLTCRSDPCMLAFDAPADRSAFVIGEVIDVMGRGPRGLDLILALDESHAIDATELAAMKSFCVSLVQGLLPFTSLGIEARVGITAFGGGSRRVLDLSFSRQTVLDAIEDFVQLDQYGDGFDTCIGCGIDDASENLITNGRLGATQAILVITNSTNELPQPNPAPHLAGALEAAAFHGHSIFVVGVGYWVGIIPELDQIATDISSVQTRFIVNDFAALPTILSTLFATLGSINTFTVGITLPDASEPTTVVDPAGRFMISDWRMVPGENVFSAQINTLYGERFASVSLLGVYPCAFACGDLTGEGVADLGDLAVFQNCFGGPSYSSVSCACSDLNGDTMVDSSDHAAFVQALLFPSPAQPPSCPLP